MTDATPVQEGAHTPGPWEVLHGRSGLYVQIGEANIPCEGNHTMSYSKTVCIIDFAGAAQWANARLIARAPSLQAENERLRNALQQIADTCGGNADGAYDMGDRGMAAFLGGIEKIADDAIKDTEGTPS